MELFSNFVYDCIKLKRKIVTVVANFHRKGSLERKTGCEEPTKLTTDIIEYVQERIENL